eukprot:Sspe_Gene.86572::Locus_57272_Transcript_1_1_Confidence_1.000_Length_2192::g.86572::m.86572
MARVALPTVVRVCPSRSLKGHTESVTCVCLPLWGAGRRVTVLSGSEDAVVRMYEFSEVETEDDIYPVIEFRGHDDVITGIGCHAKKDGGVFTVSLDGTMREWVASGGTARHVYDAEGVALLDVLCMPDEIYTATANGTIISWHCRTRARQLEFGNHSGPVTSLTSHGPKTIVSAGTDGTVSLWMRVEGTVKRVFKGITQPVTAVAVLPQTIYAASAPNPALYSPQPVPTARVIKAQALRRASDPQHTCMSWVVSSGWPMHRFPNDVTCLTIHKITSTRAQSPPCPLLLTGHASGTVTCWLTVGTSTEAIELGKELQRLNTKLSHAEVELEELRKVEEEEAFIVAEAKRARKVYHGLSKVLTAALMTAESAAVHRPGLELLRLCTKPRFQRPERVPGLRKLFINSVDAVPHLLWTGIEALRRHCNRIDQGPATKAKEAVDAKREEIAQIRERAVAADRLYTELLAQGQQVREYHGANGRITAIVAVNDAVFAAEEGGVITGWELHTGKMRERLHSHQSPVRCLRLTWEWLLSTDTEGTFHAWKPALLEGYAPPLEVVPVRAPPPKLESVRYPIEQTLPVQNVMADEEALRAEFDRLDVNGNGVLEAHEFWKYWEALDHYGEDGRRIATGILKAVEATEKQHSFESARRNVCPFHSITYNNRTNRSALLHESGKREVKGVSFEAFAQCMLRLAQR